MGVFSAFFSVLFLFLFVFCFIGTHLRHMEVPRLGVQSELQLLAYTRATETSDLSRVCDLRHISRPHRILNPLERGQGSNCNLMVPGGIHFRCASTGTPRFIFSPLLPPSLGLPLPKLMSPPPGLNPSHPTVFYPFFLIQDLVTGDSGSFQGR